MTIDEAHANLAAAGAEAEQGTPVAAAVVARALTAAALLLSDLAARVEVLEAGSGGL